MIKPDLTLRTRDRVTGEVTDEIPISDAELHRLVSDVEGWTRDQDGHWHWSDVLPVIDDSDPRDTGR